MIDAFAYWLGAVSGAGVAGILWAAHAQYERGAAAIPARGAERGRDEPLRRVTRALTAIEAEISPEDADHIREALSAATRAARGRARAIVLEDPR
jgi:hypothetical protein